MKTNRPATLHAAYRDSGVDTDEADIGLTRLIKRITQTWPPRGSLGGVQLPIGYFANVIDIGGIGLAISTDGVGSKVIIADMMKRYDTIGIDCIAMNVNDLICVGAQPLSLVRNSKPLAARESHRGQAKTCTFCGRARGKECQHKQTHHVVDHCCT